MKNRVKFFFLLVIISLLCGCNRSLSQNPVSSSVVTQITVTCQTCEDLTRHHYTSPEKIRAILISIRKLGPDFPPQTDVSAIAGKTLCMTLRCVDGTETTYRIRNNQYIQKNQGPWRMINQKSAMGFYQMILAMDSDPETRTKWSSLPAAPARRIALPAPYSHS